MATYMKLKNGDWGIRVEGPVQIGQQVTVTTKAGMTKTETVAAVLWSSGGVSLCSIQAKPQASGPRYQRGPRTCKTCGCRINYGVYCGKCEFGR